MGKGNCTVDMKSDSLFEKPHKLNRSYPGREIQGPAIVIRYPFFVGYFAPCILQRLIYRDYTGSSVLTDSPILRCQGVRISSGTNEMQIGNSLCGPEGRTFLPIIDEVISEAFSSDYSATF